MFTSIQDGSISDPLSCRLSVLQIAGVHSGAVPGGCAGQAGGKRQAEETELWQSVIQPSKELGVIISGSSSVVIIGIFIIGGSSSIVIIGIFIIGGSSDSPSTSRNAPGRIRRHAQER